MADPYLTNEQLAALGSVVAESARLELSVDMLIAQLSGLNKSQYSVFAGKLMLGSKLEIVQALGDQKLRSKKRKATFKNIIDRLRSMNSDRTTFVHGQWRHTKTVNALVTMLSNLPPTGDAFAINPRGTKKGQERALKATAIAQTASDMAAWHSTLRAFWHDVWIAPMIRRFRAQHAKKLAS